MKDNYTVTIYIDNYDGEYKQKSGDNLEQLLAWLDKETTSAAFNIEAEVKDNFKNKIIKKVTTQNGEAKESIVT